MEASCPCGLCETDGMVDLNLGGHTYKRPPAVIQRTDGVGGCEGVNRDRLAPQQAANQRASGYQCGELLLLEGFGGCAFLCLGSGLSPFQFMTSRFS